MTGDPALGVDEDAVGEYSGGIVGDLGTGRIIIFIRGEKRRIGKLLFTQEFFDLFAGRSGWVHAQDGRLQR